MAALLLERPPVLERDLEHGFEHEPRELHEPRDPHSSQDPQDLHDRSGHMLIQNRPGARGGLTLDDLVTGVWEGLALRATVVCPVCAGQMTSASEVSSADMSVQELSRTQELSGIQELSGDTLAGACLNCGSQLS